ncbi:glycosyltransferase family 4 protein [Chloroflexota bacterium]
MSHVLFLTQVLPYPLDAGPKIRAYYVLRHLARHHDITLVTFIRPSDPPDAVKHLHNYCQRIVTVPIDRSLWRDVGAYSKSLLSDMPFLITRDRVPRMEAALLKIISEERFDVVHADQLWMAAYALYARMSADQNGYQPNLILDQHNAVHLIPARLAQNSANPLIRQILQREARLMRRYEAQVCDQFDRVVWVSGDDLKAVASYQPSIQKLPLKTTIIPICIDPQISNPVLPLPKSDRILFLGGMHWPPNAEGLRWIAQNVLPIVREQIPDVELLAVGKEPPADLQKTGGLSLPGYIEDVESIWSGCRVFVVPLLSGGGMRVKILDTWAHGLPVVSTSIGAEGIKIKSGSNILIADTPHEFSQAIVRILRDDELASQLGASGRKTVEDTYNWRMIYKDWDKVYSLAHLR